MPNNILYAQIDGQLLFMQGLSGIKLGWLIFAQALDIMLPCFDGSLSRLLPLTGQVLSPGGDSNLIKLLLALLERRDDLVFEQRG